MISYIICAKTCKLYGIGWRGPAKISCYLCKSTAAKENAFWPIQGRAIYLFCFLFYMIVISAPALFMSSMKLGYDTATESGSLTVQSPTNIPAMQNAMNSL